MAEDEKHSTELTDAEAELYDRQIRLWGLESQKRLRAARILIVGLNGLAAEIAKNVILAGVKSVTFLDHRKVSMEDMCSQFFLSKSQIGENRAEASLERARSLNPLTIIIADTEDVHVKSYKYFENFDVVCATQCSISQLETINDKCRSSSVKFFAADVWGAVGFSFADLDVHEFVEDIVKSRKIQQPEGVTAGNEKFEKITVTVKRSETYVRFSDIMGSQVGVIPKDADTYFLVRIMLNYREMYGEDLPPSERHSEAFRKEADTVIQQFRLCHKLDKLLEGELCGQLSPICAIVGGVVAQDIIKTVSRKEAPLNNLFLFNPETMSGSIFKLPVNTVNSVFITD